MEKIQGRLFPEWVVPLLILSVLFTFWTIYAAIWYLHLDFPGMDPVAPLLKGSQFPLKVMNVITSCLSATLLSAVFMPGLLATILQLIRGQVAVTLPLWLRAWINCRKQLGLLCLIVSPEYYYNLYVLDDVTFQWGMMTAYGEALLLLGIVAFILLTVLAASSNPSVGDSLSYMEWRAVFSWLGWLTMSTVFVHNLLYVLSFNNCPVCNKDKKIGAGWPETSTGTRIPAPSWITIGIVGLPILMKILLTIIKMLPRKFKN
eukprot:gene28509-31666_t